MHKEVGLVLRKFYIAFLITALCLIVVTSFTFAQSSEQEIESLTRQLAGAHLTKDTSTLDRLLASSVIVTNSTGRRLNKEQLIQEVGNLESRAESATLEAVTVNFPTPDKAVLNGRLKAVSREGTKVESRSFSVTWERQAGSWKITNIAEATEATSPISRSIVNRVSNPPTCGFRNRETCQMNCPGGQFAHCKCAPCDRGIWDWFCEKCDCVCGGCPSPSDYVYACKNDPRRFCDRDSPINPCPVEECVLVKTCLGWLEDPLRTPRPGGGPPSNRLPPRVPQPALPILGTGPAITVPPNVTVTAYALFPTAYETHLNVTAKVGDQPLCTWGGNQNECSWRPYGQYTGVISKTFTNRTGQPAVIDATVDEAISSNGGGAVNADLGVLGWGFTFTPGRPMPSPITMTTTPHKAVLLVVRNDGTPISPNDGLMEGRIDVPPGTNMMFHAIFPTQATTKLVVEAKLPNQPAEVIWQPQTSNPGNWTFRWTNQSQDAPAIVTIRAFNINGAEQQISAGARSFVQGTLEVIGFGHSNSTEGRNPYRVIFISTPEK